MLKDLEQKAQFGDSFAPVTGLFTATALIASVWAVVMQREELRLQREETAAHRREAQRANEQLGRQLQLQVLAALGQTLAADASLFTKKIEIEISQSVGTGGRSTPTIENWIKEANKRHVEIAKLVSQLAASSIQQSGDEADR